MYGWTRWDDRKPEPLRVVWGWSKETGLVLGFNRFGTFVQTATGKTAAVLFWQPLEKPAPPIGVL